VPWDRRISAVGKGIAMSEDETLRALRKMKELLVLGTTPDDAEIDTLYGALEARLLGTKRSALPYPSMGWEILRKCCLTDVFFEGAYVEIRGRLNYMMQAEEGLVPVEIAPGEDWIDVWGIVRHGLISLDLPEGRALQAGAPRGQLLVVLCARGLRAQIGDEVVVCKGMEGHLGGLPKVPRLFADP
jgi:hypothetical protein